MLIAIVTATDGGHVCCKARATSNAAVGGRKRHCKVVLEMQ